MAAFVSDRQQQVSATESSIDIAVQDVNIVSHIASHLLSSGDRLSAAMVCRVWNEAVVFGSRRLSVRSRSFLPNLAQRFPHIQTLDLTPCVDELQDQDLRIIATSFSRLESLSIGHPDLPQLRIYDDGFQFLSSSFRFLQQVSLSSLPCITSRCIANLTRGCSLLRSVSLENCVSLTDEALEAVSKCRSLEELILRGSFKFTEHGLAAFNNCRDLLRVCLELYSLDLNPALKSLATKCLRIQEICLTVRYVDLGDIAKCTTLTCLRVETEQWFRLDEAILAISASNKDLRELVLLNHFSPLSDAAIFGIVQNCGKLEKLRVDATRLTEITLQCVMECKTLKSLALDHFRSAGQGLAEVGLCGLDLIEFSLRSGSGIRDVELQTLMHGNRRLEILDLQCCHGLSHIGFSAIGCCSNLQSLNLSFTDVDNLSLMAMANGINALKWLSVVKCEFITDIGVISHFTALESLTLDQCPFVSDEGLDLVAVGCSQLAHLSLANTPVTDKGLYNLTSCSQLRSLKIPYCRSVEGPGLIAIVHICKWFQYVVISHRFRGSKIVEELRNQCCMVQLEADDMALVPFGFNLFM